MWIKRFKGYKDAVYRNVRVQINLRNAGEECDTMAAVRNTDRRNEEATYTEISNAFRKGEEVGAT